MRKSPTIRLADPREDRARPESIAMIAVAAWGVGFALMLGVAKLMPKYSALEPSNLISARAQLPILEPAPTRAVSATRGVQPKATHIVKPAPQKRSADPPAHAPVLAPAPAPVHAPAPVPAPAPETLTAKLTPQPSAALRPPSAARKNHPAQKRSFHRNLLAYLRCEGTERPHARFPCPRDEKFEDSVWHILEGLTVCETDPGTGSGELRLVLRRSQVSGIEWKAGSSGQGLNVRAIGKCAGAKLAELRTRLRAPETLVSFRFSLE